MSTDRDDTHVENLTIRLLDGADLRALRRLAERDSSGIPAMPMLGAELDGELIAAIPLDADSAAIADPFRPTADARALLENRALQLREADNGRRRRRGLRGILPRGGGSLGGSPPGAAAGC